MLHKEVALAVIIPLTPEDHELPSIQHADGESNQARPVVVLLLEVVEASPNARDRPDSVLRKTKLPFASECQLSGVKDVLNFIFVAGVKQVTTQIFGKSLVPAEVAVKVL